MNKTDRLISNIGAIITMLENFPMSLFEFNGKVYTSAFEFILDILRAFGLTDKMILDFIISKIYGFEGQESWVTVNGLYEKVERGDIKFNPQNKFISALEVAIKAILMGLFTGVFTCSAIPILPHGVFDVDDISITENGDTVYLMPNNIRNVTTEHGPNGPTNDITYKIKIPVSTIDMIGMLSISPVSSEGSLYYNVNGVDRYYHKKQVKAVEKQFVYRDVEPGEYYTIERNVYDSEKTLEFEYNSGGYLKYSLYDSNHSLTSVSKKLKIKTKYLDGGRSMVADFVIEPGESSSQQIFIPASRGNQPTEIKKIKVNGYKQEFDLYDEETDTKTHVYIKRVTSSPFYTLGGKELKSELFGASKINITEPVTLQAATLLTHIQCIENLEYKVYQYVPVPDDDVKSIRKQAIRTTYVPQENVYEDSYDYIVCYECSIPATQLYKTDDMNAFIWYCLNRGGKGNQIEENHLMWDNRNTLDEDIRVGAASWNAWYASKSAEGQEFSYNNNPDLIKPIIQIEKYGDYYNINGSELLVRIPAQTFFAPKKRKRMLYGGSIPRHPLNASIYKFDWEYLKSITLLHPKMLLVRFIEHLLGFTLDVASNVKFDYTRKRIELVLSKAIVSMLEADDMAVENCWKSFSNEDFNELLNETILERYKSTEYNGEVAKVRKHDIDDYLADLNGINSSSQSQGTVTKITKMVNDVMVIPGIEPSTDWEYNFKFDANFLKKLYMAIVMPIVECIFTPQVLLLMMINFQILGIADLNNAFNISSLMELLMKKILGLIKSIIIYIKDMIIKFLMDFLMEVVIPWLKRFVLLLFLEKLTDWLLILTEAIKCIPLFMGSLVTREGHIDEVYYADIVNNKNLPTNALEC